jgi:hypothetical protein
MSFVSSSTGTAPESCKKAARNNSEVLELDRSTARTSQTMVTQIDFRHRFAEIAHVWWERESRIATQLDGSLLNKT